jgi:hypothetical protein
VGSWTLGFKVQGQESRLTPAKMMRSDLAVRCPSP